MFLQNPTLLSQDDSLLFIVDIQEKLAPAVQDQKKVIWNTVRLIHGATLFQLPVILTEQYPKGLGPTVAKIKDILPENTFFFEKKSFSAVPAENLLATIQKFESVQKIILCGMETHVCVQQTALDLLTAGFQVHLVVDAVSSRFETNYTTALNRMESSGVDLTTTEAVLFELCRTADAPQFKQISALVRETMDEDWG